MTRKTHVFSVFVISLAATFLVSVAVFSPQVYDEETDFRLESGEGVSVFEFEESIRFMASDTGNASFFMDADMDGEPERELEILHDGEVHELRELVSKGESTYMLYVRYHDGPAEDDSWIEVYRVRRV